MPIDDRLAECAAPVLRDVTVTTGLRLHISPWEDVRAGIGYAVHPAGVVPQRPVWETFRLLARNADSMALHPFPAESPQEPGYGDRDDLVLQIAGGVQQMTQMLLWQRGSDPTWPRCPDHPGGHDLRVGGRNLSWRVEGGLPVEIEDEGAAWVCPRGDFRVAIGQLQVTPDPTYP